MLIILLLLFVQLHVNDLRCSIRNDYYRYRRGSTLFIVSSAKPALTIAFNAVE